MDIEILKKLKETDGRRFPSWDDFPEVDLYMDQVIELVNGYMRSISPSGEAAVITASMINNYVKSKLMPPPFKKRYSKLHLAYIIMICFLKQTFGVSSLEKILPENVNIMRDDVIKELYEVFTQSGEEAYLGALSDIEELSAQCGDDTRLYSVRLMAEVNVRKAIAEAVIREMYAEFYDDDI